MAEILNFALVCAPPEKARSAAVPAQFQDAVDRHQKNLITLSVALKAAGITPVAAAAYVDAELASFQNGLFAAVAGQEEVYRGQH
jgi:hypothetical protein